MADRHLRRHLSQDEINRGIGMLHSGLSQRHVGNVLGVSQSVVSHPVQPASVQELRQALLEEWDQIPQYKIRRLISSMRRRCQAVIEARGHNTLY